MQISINVGDDRCQLLLYLSHLTVSKYDRTLITSMILFELHREMSIHLLFVCLCLINSTWTSYVHLLNAYMVFSYNATLWWGS